MSALREHHTEDAGHDFDVVIVGYGPIGELAATMLGRRGYRVGVFERWPELYPLPRAVVYDDEIARVFAQEGMLEDVLAISATVPDHYEWRNREGEALLKIDWSLRGPAGRQVATFFSQPELQAVLDRHALATPGVEVHKGWQVEGVTDLADRVEVHVRQGVGGGPGTWTASEEVRTVTARYVIGADGANSTVRRHMDVGMEDLGFEFDWLIVDVIPKEEGEWSPMNWQLCDPVRPTTIVSGGPGRRRWEFMRLPGESIAELNTLESAWRLLEPWGRTPENTTLERHAVYTFQAKWASTWRKGRVMLAGDAAHLMPPFAGQGMCSGLRDVANLVWKLDLVLSGRAEDALLDTYTSERLPHLQHFIHVSVELGRIICVLDEDLARERDVRMIAGEGDPARVLPAGPPPRLGPGVVRDQELAGLLMPQARVSRGGEVGLLDELIEPAFYLLCVDPDVPALLDGERATRFAAMGGVVLGLAPGGPVADEEGAYGRWLAEAGAVAVLVRPDSYVFGIATSHDDVRRLVDDLLEGLRSGSVAHESDRPVTA